MITKLVLIMHVGTGDCVYAVFVWEETGVPGGNHLPNLGTTWPSHMRRRVICFWMLLYIIPFLPDSY